MKSFIPNILTFLTLILILLFTNQIFTDETSTTVNCYMDINSTKCHDKKFENIIDFSQIKTMTDTLTIDCNFESVNPLFNTPPIYFKKLKKLRELSIKHCPSLQLRENLFLSLENLQSLYLYSIAPIDDILKQLKPLNSLKDLVLYNNKIETLDFEFGIFIQLRTLSLIRNMIKNITTNSFKNCYQLLEISLSNNAIPSLVNKNEFGNVTNIFDSKYLPNLKTLELYSNQLEHVTCSMIPKTVEILYLSQNPLKAFTCNEPHLTNHMLKILIAEKTLMYNLEICSFPPSIEYFSLKHVVNPSAVAGRLSARVFSPLKKLNTLHLEGRYICDVDRFAFSSSSGLRSHVNIYLDVSCTLSKYYGNDYDTPIGAIETVSAHNKQSLTVFCQIVHVCLPTKFYALFNKYNSRTLVKSDCGNLMLTEVPLTLTYDTLELYLDGNNFTSVNLHQILENYPYLDDLYLNSSNIRRIETNNNSSFRYLKHLQLQNNLLTELRMGEFYFLKIDELHLQNNNISEFYLYKRDQSIKIVYFQNNSMSKILRRFCNYHINILYLDYNTITDVELDCDNDSPLEKLFLPNNHLTVLKSYSFSRLPNLEELHLGWNDIQHIEKNSFHGLPQLKKLYLQGNKLTTIGQEIFYIRANNIENNSQFKKLFPKVMMFVRTDNIGKNNSRYEDNFNNNFNNLIEIHLEGNSIERINLSLFDVFPSLVSLYLNSNRIREITSDQPSSLPSLNELHLEKNLLTDLNGKEFKGLQNVQRLFLHQNELSSINKDTFKKLTSLEILTVHGNKLKRLAILQFKFSSKLKNLTIHQNPFLCECKYFRDIFTTVNFISNVSQVKCLSTENKKYLLEDYMLQFCNNKEMIIGLSAFIGLLLLTMFISVLLYRYRLEIQVILYSQFKVRFFHDQWLDERKPFHAFIAYSCDDREFVAEQLLPRLEKYRICLHDRNFVVGAFIQENIVNAVNHSACTVIVFSRSFVKSSWCRFEFRTAHDKSLSKGRRPIIVIMLEDVPSDDMEEEMKVYLRTSTYLRWGDQLFWEKLYFVLPAVNDNNRYNQQQIPLQQFSC